ncbi:hypothetical protein BGZ83_004513 [Gryganskiella cystojenkinii]|nr:hypothetical protein BGZ83_004513 [Gryganskiella cystojenkinii]
MPTTHKTTHGRDRDDMRRDAKCLLNRLKSIQADAAFVSELADLFPHFPVLANERCGTWYVHPSKIHRPGVYFKSTDGHTGIWDFNLRRYNPHLINAIIDNGGCIIVDSTRKGKRVPDALSKTIPIWCATINNAVQKCALQNQIKELVSISQARTVECNEEASSTLLVPALDSERWDIRYHSSPSLISRSEHAQIAEKISGFADKLMRFTDMTPLTTRLLKPIRPIWLTPQSFIMKDDPPDYTQVGFLPVICLSASRVVQDGMEERNGYLYVQGSGDDEEMWSKGLTPDLFWENVDYLLEEGISSAECDERAKKIVQDARKSQLERSKPSEGNKKSLSNPASSSGLFTPSMELCSEIKPSPIWIGNNASGRIPACWEDGYDIVINCGAEIKREPHFELGGEGEQEYVIGLGGVGHGGAQASLCRMKAAQWSATAGVDSSPVTATVDKDFYYLHLPIAEGKKGQHDLLAMIPIAIQGIRKIFMEAKEGQPRILIHCQQGMDRSVGISLALLVACFDEETGAFIDRAGDLGDRKISASKELIQRRLFQIMSHRLAARPSRATLKMVNTYFMSPTDPPPAKYK